MKEKIVIYYFSGTGNTEFIVRQLSQCIQGQEHQVDTLKMEDLLKGKQTDTPGPYTCTGIAYPVYGFGAPAIVYDFLRKFPLSGGQEVFILGVSCDPHPLNNTATLLVRKMLIKQKADIFLEWIVPMPANWGFLYPEALSRQLIKRAEELIPGQALEVLGRVRRLLQPKVRYRLLAWICRLEDLGAHFYARDYKVNNNCTLCRKCVKNCPRDNIRIHKNRIRFGWKCIICMRCVYGCPEKAIGMQFYRFTLPKESYSLKKILKNGEAGDVFVTKETRGYYRHFYEYLYGE